MLGVTVSYQLIRAYQSAETKQLINFCDIIIITELAFTETMCALLAYKFDKKSERRVAASILKQDPNTQKKLKRNTN